MKTHLWMIFGLLIGALWIAGGTLPSVNAQKDGMTPVPGQPPMTLPPGLNAPQPLPGGGLPPGVAVTPQPGVPLPDMPVVTGTPTPFDITEVVLETQILRDRTFYTLHLRGTQPDACDFPPIERFNYETGWLVIEWYRIIPPNVRCAAGPRTVETTLVLDPLLLQSTAMVVENTPYDFYALQINAYTALIALGDIEAALLETEREPLAVESVETTVSTEFTGIAQNILRVRGAMPDGCTLPVRGAVEVINGVLTVSVYRPLPTAAITCPALEAPNTYTLDVPLSAETIPPGDYAYDVNGLSGQLTVTGGPMRREFVPDPANANRSYHGITAVEVLVMESNPPQITLDVTGYIPDGCPGEVTTDIRRSGTTITVEIYRTVRPDVMCPQVIVDFNDRVPLGTLPPGMYTIRVNGFVVTAQVQ